MGSCCVTGGGPGVSRHRRCLLSPPLPPALHLPRSCWLQARAPRIRAASAVAAALSADRAAPSSISWRRACRSCRSLPLLVASPTWELSRDRTSGHGRPSSTGLYYIISAYSDFTDLALGAAIIAVLAWAAALGQLAGFIHRAGSSSASVRPHLSRDTERHPYRLSGGSAPARIAIVLIALAFTRLQVPEPTRGLQGSSLALLLRCLPCA